MEFSTTTAASLLAIRTQALAVGVFKDGILTPAADALDIAAGGRLRAIIKREFDGKVGECLAIHGAAGITAERIILLGLGAQAALKATTIARAHDALANYCVRAHLARATSTLAALPCPDAQVGDLARVAARLMIAASYRYDATFGQPRPLPKIRDFALHVTRQQAAAARAGLDQGAAIGAGVNLARMLGDLPGNVCTPTYLARTARDLAHQFDSLKVEILERRKIEALKMGAFLAVARGSSEPPAFIILRHTPRTPSTLPPIVLVGKGITFDSGGISIKPGAGMDEMKFDMCGAASVLGTLRAVAQLELPREVIGLIPSCENLPGGSAVKPGDVVTSLSGQTIEVLNTDAEGRLILCDALTYAERFKPAAVIDIATLTGACVIALGHVNSGLFSADDTLTDGLLAAARQSQDPAWHMPLDEDYQELLDSNFADMANIGGRPAGAVTAACFLSRFTKKYPWAHLDIAGTAWLQGKQKGATGRPVPLLTQYLIDQCTGSA